MRRAILQILALSLLWMPSSAQARGKYAYMCYQYKRDLVGKRNKFCEKPKWAKTRVFSRLRTEVTRACKGPFGKSTRASVYVPPTPMTRMLARFRKECHQSISLAQAIHKKFVEATLSGRCIRGRFTVTVREYRDKMGRVRVRRWTSSTGKIVTNTYPKYLDKLGAGNRAGQRDKAMMKVVLLLCRGNKSARAVNQMRRWLRQFSAKRLRGLKARCKKEPSRSECRELKRTSGSSGVRN